MAIEKHPHSALIDTLGKKAVSATFDLDRASLYAWRTRGIPYRKRITFAKLAAQNGLAVPSDFFEG